MSRFDWVIFDAVGTVITPRPSVARIYWEAGLRFGSRLGEDEIRKRFGSAFRETERIAGNDHTTSEEAERRWWREIISRVFDDITEHDSCFEHLFRHFAQPSAWRWYDDVAPTLRQLQSDGLRIGIASNFDSRLHGLIDAWEHGDVISLRAISSLIGYRKPSERFFQAMCDMADVPTERILFVGDDPTNDVAGATAAGLAVIRIDRQDMASPSPGVVTDLRQILPLVIDR